MAANTKGVRDYDQEIRKGGPNGRISPVARGYGWTIRSRARKD